MSTLIDTNIAVYIRDGEPEILTRLASLPAPPIFSVVTRLELEAGVVAAAPVIGARRRIMLDTMYEDFVILPFDDACAIAYGRIIAETGFSRPRTLDRMIAATALAHDLPLITINGQHFRDIPGLNLIEWPSPGTAA